MLITVTVNDVEHQVRSELTLAGLQQQLELPNHGCVFAINEQIIPKGLWETQPINDGDQISLFQAIAGG